MNIRSNGAVLYIVFIFYRVQCLLPMLCESSSRTLERVAPHPWLARLVPHPNHVTLTICPAVCIHPNFFYTAARCIVGLTIGWISVEYGGQYLKVKALVWTRESPPYRHGDGFVLTENSDHVSWHTVDYSSGPFRFEDFKNDVGITMMKVMTLVLDKGKEVKMVELDVVVDKEMSNYRYDKKQRYGNVYRQLAFHPCTKKEIKQKLPKCKLYIKVTGAPIVHYDRKTEKYLVVGVSIWGDCSNIVANYPVGFTYIHKKELADLQCAKIIAKDKTIKPEKGYYDELCKSNVPLSLKYDGSDDE